METKQVVAAFFFGCILCYIFGQILVCLAKQKKPPPPKKIEVKPINENGFNTIPNEWKK